MINPVAILICNLYMISSHKKNILDFVFVSLLFALLVLLRVDSFQEKKELHTDEIYSVMLVNNNPYYWSAIDDGYYTGNDLKSKIFDENVSSDFEKNDCDNYEDFASDLKHLWLNNGDTPHASLYYMLLRVSFYLSDLFNLSPKDIDVGYISCVGFILNIFLFCVSFFLMLLLLKVLFKDKIILILVGLAVCFAIPLSIENTLLIREYQLAETFLIFLTLVSVTYINKLYSKQNISLSFYGVMFSISVAGALSTGYLNAIYVLLIGVVLIYASIKTDNKKLSVLIVCSALLGLLIAWAMYLGFFNFILYKTVHTSRAFESPVKVLEYVFVRDISNGSFKIYGLSLLIFAIAFILVMGRGKELFKIQAYLWLPILAIISIYLVQYTAVLKMSRYSFPLMPIVALVFPLVLCKLPKIPSQILGVALSLFYIFSGFANPVTKTYGWGYVQKQLEHGATIYGLNSTEIVQVIPCLNDTAIYRLVSCKEALLMDCLADRNLQNDDSISRKNYLNRVVMKSSCKDIPQSMIEERRRLIGRQISVIDVAD